MADDDDTSPDQLFQELLDDDVQYLPHSATQRVPGNDGVDFGRILTYVVPSEALTSSQGTFGAVDAPAEAAEYMVLANWLMEMANRSGCTISVETLYSAPCADVGQVEVAAWRVWVLVPHDQYIKFAQHCQAHLTGKPVPTEEEEPPAGRRAVGRPRKKQKLAQNPDAPRSSTPRASWRNVTSEAYLLGVLRKQSLGEDGDDVFSLDWDSIVSEATGSADVSAGSSVYSLFDARAHFASPRNQAWYTAKRVPPWQRRQSAYFSEGTFDPSTDVFSHYPWALRVVDAHCMCMRPDAESILSYLLPNMEVPLRLLRDKFSQLAKFSGRGVSMRYCAFSDDATLDLLRGDGASHRHYSRSVVITAVHPLRRMAGTLYSEQWKAKLYPVQYLIETENRSKKAAIGELRRLGKVDDAEVRRVHEQLSDNVASMLSSHALGTVPYWHLVWADHMKLTDEINADTEVARCALKLLNFRDIQGASAVQAPPFDQGVQSVLDTVTNHMGVTPQQLRVVAKFLFSICASARHQFGPQWAQALFGQSDVGKSYCMKIISCLLPPSMQEEENDASDKAWVLDGAVPFKFCWMDEIGVGLSETSKGRSRDSKTLQAGMSNGVQTYKQYKRGKEGKQDKLQVYHVDCRKNLAITSNKCLNDAMMSRVHVEETYEEPVAQTGRSKIDKAACDATGVLAQATSLAMQLLMTQSLYLWLVEACGAFVKPIDMRMFEVFTGLYNSMLVPSGFDRMKCRQMDRHKTLALGLMNFGVMSSLRRDPRMQAIAEDNVRATAYYIVRAAVVPMRAVEVAYNLSQPSRAFAQASTRALVGMKNQIVHDMREEPVLDTTKAYYVTKISKAEAAHKVAQSSRLAGNDAAQDVIQTALTKMECTKHNGMAQIKYDMVCGADTLHVLASLVDQSVVLTDHQAALVEWLQGVHNDETFGDLGYWRYEAKERHVLFSRQVRDCIIGTATMQVVDNMPDRINLLKNLATPILRQRALRGLALASVDDGSVVEMKESSEDPYFGMVFMDDEADPLYAMAQPCSEQGPFAGRRMAPRIMSGAFAVPIDFLRDYKRGEEMKRESDAALAEFQNVLMAATGEAREGDVLFRNVSSHIHHDSSSSSTSTCAKVEGAWTYPNPRVMSATDVVEADKYMTYDTVHPENKTTITLTHESGLYRKMVEEACAANCMGMTLSAWERAFDLPPMFPT